MKMKKFLAVAMTAALAVGLTACGTSSSSSSAGGSSAGGSTEKEDVSLIVWGAEEDQDLLQQMVESFKKEYADEANFTIDIGVQSESTAKDTILTDVEAAADVYAFPDDQLIELVNAGALLEVIDDYKGRVTSENNEGSVAAATYNDTIYAYPRTADNGYFLFYNKSVVSEEQAQTMDGILEACEKAGMTFSMEFNSGWYLYSFFGGAGFDVTLNDDGTTECSWNDKADYTGVEVVEGMLDIASSSAYKLLTDAEFVSGVQDGTVAAGVNGVWNAAAAEEAWGDNYAAAKLPTYTVDGKQVQMSSYAGYKLIGVNKTTDEPYWASTFANFITNYDNQVLYAEERGVGPSNTEAAQIDAVQNSPAIAALASQSEFATVQRVGSNYWDPTKAFGQIIASGNPDGTDLQELLDNMVDAITAPIVQ